MIPKHKQGKEGPETGLSRHVARASQCFMNRAFLSSYLLQTNPTFSDSNCFNYHESPKITGIFSDIHKQKKKLLSRDMLTFIISSLSLVSQ